MEVRVNGCGAKEETAEYDRCWEEYDEGGRTKSHASYVKQYEGRIVVLVLVVRFKVDAKVAVPRIRMISQLSISQVL